MTNWFNLSIRRFLRNKVNSFINIFGLALGMMVFLLIFIYVRHEFSYDNFHKNADHVFRLIKENSPNGDNYLGNALQAVLPAPLAEVLKSDISGITHVARLDSRKTLIVDAEGKTFYEDNYHAADEDLFSILTFKVLYGNNGNTLKNPFTVAISSSTAVRYFGTKNAVGRVLDLTGNKGSFGQYTVDMVFSEFPTNSSYQFNIILRFEDHANVAHTNNLTWNNYNHYFFVRTAEKSSVSDIQEQIKSLFPKT
ncbi:MAG: ABC transporter permease [Cytophagales bacterium]|nr:ABC transporter permease [Cytophagales bacterium]